MEQLVKKRIIIVSSSMSIAGIVDEEFFQMERRNLLKAQRKLF